MFSYSQINACCNVLTGCIDADKINCDKWIVEKKFYGVDFYTCYCDALVFVGARHGLEILLSLHNFAPQDVVIIEQNQDKRNHIAHLLEQYPQMKGRVTILSGINDHELREKLQGKKINIRVSSCHFNVELFDFFTQGFNIGHICGEFSDCHIDPLDVYRRCALTSDSFYWRRYGNQQPLVGNRRNYACEITVIVPVYNVSDYIDRCLSSLANQTIRDFEVIVVNDGSPDNCAVKAGEWAEKFPGRVKVINKANGGCASARNAGLNQAQGQYIGFVDGDDWVEPQMYEDLYRAAILKTADIAQCGYQEVYETGEVVRFPLNVDAQRLDLLRERPTMWRRIYASQTLRNKGIYFPEHIRRFDDLPFQFETFLAARVISNIPFCYYNYRQGRLGQDISVRDERLFVHFEIFDWIYQRNSETLDFHEEKKLFELELDVHYWASSVITPNLQPEYLLKTAFQLFTAKRIISQLQMLAIARAKGRHMVKFYLRLWLKRYCRSVI